jgi:hypothetical protein
VRKRLIIGAIAAVMIGVVGYVFWQPGRGTVEWHKKKYLGAHRSGKIENWISFHFSPKVHHVLFFWKGTAAEHQRALLKLGYLKESVFVVSNASVMKAVRTVRFELPRDIDQFTRFSYGTPGTLIVVAPAEWSEKIGAAIRKADVPENK